MAGGGGGGAGAVRTVAFIEATKGVVILVVAVMVRALAERRHGRIDPT